MKGYKLRIINSLAFRVITPVLAIVLLAGLGVYLFVLSSVSDFADRHIKEELQNFSRSIYNICDKNMNELLRTGLSKDEKALRDSKGITVGLIEDFIRDNNLKGSIKEDGKGIQLAVDISQGFSEIIEKTVKGHSITSLEYGEKKYYVNHIYFEPWKWHMVLIKDAAEYSALKSKVMLAYRVTGFILLMSIILFLYFLNTYIRRPVSKIIKPIQKGEKPEYKGIHEFEFLSDNIRRMIETLENETKMLNNIYHIAASRRGEDFFDEVAMAINRLFGLNSLIGKINPDGDSIYVAAMYFDDKIKKGMNISLKGTPCEDVVTMNQMCVIERDVYKQFPRVDLLTKIKADSYIGIAIFNRKGNVIGIINAFGKEREFTESDIKVFQTIGQMVATEFEMKEKEEEEARIREELFQTQKMDAIGVLAGGIAHDFNNILQGILGYASLLKMKISENDPIYKPLEVIEHSAESAADLTKQLLGFARKGKYFIEPINLNNVVENVRKIITRTFDRAIEIKANINSDLWTIEGDKSQIEHVVLKLCINARDAMPAGGVIRIDTLNSENKVGDALHSTVIPGRYAVLKISDTGKGMDQEIKNRIFEPFFTTKGIGKGTGMGLAMVYGIVKNHNGFITVDSEIGKGSTFTVYFPAVEKEIKRDEPELKEIPRGRGTILVVDDEEFIRALSKEALGGLGYNVLEASNGEEAIEIYKNQRDNIELVVLDLIMPKMGGKETFE
ncbi:MAG: response regulator, partial [Nitrospirae bacterium]|nr:response regulator [Nitrospirota bacterium]